MKLSILNLVILYVCVFVKSINASDGNSSEHAHRELHKLRPSPGTMILVQDSPTAHGSISNSSLFQSSPSRDTPPHRVDIDATDKVQEFADILDAIIHHVNPETSMASLIKPYLHQGLIKENRRSKLMKLQSVPVDQWSTYKPNEELEMYINKRVNKAMEHALVDENAIKLKYKSEAEERVTKKKVAIITAITAIITACLAAGVSIATTLNSCGQ